MRSERIRILRPGSAKYGCRLLHGTVDDSFLDGLQPWLLPHDKLTEGQHEIAFQRQRGFLPRCN